MTTRLTRKNRTDIIIKGCGGLSDAFDDMMKHMFRINDDEYDYICKFATDQELDYIVDEMKSFSSKREAISTVNRLLTEYYKTNDND